MYTSSDYYYRPIAFNREVALPYLERIKKQLETVNAKYISNHVVARVSAFWVTYNDSDRDWYSKTYIAELDKEACAFCGRSSVNDFYYINGTEIYDDYLRNFLSSYWESHDHCKYTPQDDINIQKSLCDWRTRILNDYDKSVHFKCLISILYRVFKDAKNEVEQLATEYFPKLSVNFDEITEFGATIERLDYKAYDNHSFNDAARIKSITGLFGGYGCYGEGCKPMLPNEKIIRIPESISTNCLGTLTITEIGEGVFENLTETEEIYLPFTLQKIAWSFWRCRNLRKINIFELSPYRKQSFLSKDGVLYNGDYTELMAYPNMHGRSYEIPEGVKSIHSKAFKDCDNLEELILPSTLERIGTNAFYRCMHLKRIIVNQKKGKLVVAAPFGEYGDVCPKWYWLD